MAIRRPEKELSKFVKQNSAGNLREGKTEAKNKWQRLDLNQRPRAIVPIFMPNVL
jgi:hypothetical protein